MNGPFSEARELCDQGTDPGPARSPTTYIRFALAGVIGTLAVISVPYVLFGINSISSPVFLGTLIYLAAMMVAVLFMQRTYPHDRIGACNLVTLTRLVIVGILLVATLAAVPPGYALLALAVVALCLDGVDGWFARKQELSSDFGARFDVEVDAAFALLLTIYAVRTGVAGAYVLALGLPHYLFWCARGVWPWLNAPLPERFSRKAVCVLQITTIIALLIPQLVGWPLHLMIAVTVIALIWSFGIDIRWLYRNRL